MALLAAIAAPSADADEALEGLDKRWKKLTGDEKIEELGALDNVRSPDLIAYCKRWLADPNVRVRTALVQVLAHTAIDNELRERAEKVLALYLDKHLDWRADEEKREFNRVCKKYGRSIPPDSEMQAGPNWQDPWDEDKRTLPGMILAERKHMMGVLASIEEARCRSLRQQLQRLFREHHDPEVLVRVVKLFGAWKEYRLLPDMADLARIQAEGRMVGGTDAGNKDYETQRLKWDVHKDRLWWSRPQYVTRVSYPIAEAASKTTGAEIRFARDLDAWILANESLLRKKGVPITSAFRRRAATTQK
ncbi:MAG: hypothetical protein V3T86_03825 [Planctomycetota bacterium]